MALQHLKMIKTPPRLLTMMKKKQMETVHLKFSNGDCSHNEDTSMTGTVSNQLEKNIMNESNGDSSLNVDISKTGAVGKELERTVMN